MAILMQSPEGAQAQVSSTEAETLKELGWKERGYADYKKAVAKPEPVAPAVESATIVQAAPQDTPPRRPGRPPKIASEI